MAGNYDVSSAIVAPAIARPNNSSGRGMFAELPAEVRGWNWGAFWLGWIWGIKNRTSAPVGLVRAGHCGPRRRAHDRPPVRRGIDPDRHRQGGLAMCR